MREADAVVELLARIDRTQRLLRRIVDEYQAFLEGDFELLGRKNTSAIVIAEMMVDYYTCAETVFLRTSQFFGNHLEDDRWHADLLDRMTLHLEGVRDPVISEETAGWLRELMKFRHFRRYYFELEYDWDKLDYLQTVFNKVGERLPGDLQGFASFLQQLV